MKEVIGIAILVASLFGGTKMVRIIHDEVRKVALTKVAQGLPTTPQPRKHGLKENKK